MNNKKINDPFIQLYASIQEVWNDKKGLDFKIDQSQRINRLKKFSESLPTWKEKIDREIVFLEKIYTKQIIQKK